MAVSIREAAQSLDTLRLGSCRRAKPCECRLADREAVSVASVARSVRVKQPGHVRLLGGAGGKEVHGVNASRLPDALDSADPLLEAKRCPRQLEIDHQPTALVKVEPFAGGIGCEEHRRCAAR